MSTKVSIIVPVYNAEKYLDECVQSILTQELTDWELFLVNDGSRDNSLVICRKYEAQDSRIHVLDGPNQGVSAARNRGLDAARGEYIGFVDADDFIAPQMYRKLVELADAEKVDLVFCANVEWREGKTRIQERLGTRWSGVRTGKETLQELVQTKGESCWRVLYRRILLETANLRFVPGRKYAEDTMFLCECLLAAENVGFCPDVLYYYRIEGQNTTEHYIPELEQNINEYTDFLLELTRKAPELNSLRDKVLGFRAVTVLYMIYNVCKEGTPLSYGKRIRYARELARKIEYKEALKAALTDKNYDFFVMLEIFMVKHRMCVVPVTYYTVKSLVQKRKAAG